MDNFIYDILTIINIYCFEFENVTFVYLYDLNIHISPNNLNHQEGKWVIFQNWVIGKLMLYRKLMSYSRSSLILHFLMFEFEIANKSLLRCPSPLARCAIKEVTISSQNWGSPCFGQTSKCQSRSRVRLSLYVFLMSAYRTSGRSTNFIIRAAVNNVLYMMSRTPATLCVTFFPPDVSNNTYFHELRSWSRL